MTDLDRAGRTELHYASNTGDIARVRALLASGEDPRLADQTGWTPLHFAAQGCHADIATLLLDAGAAVEAEDDHGNTPLWRAVFAGSKGDGAVISVLRAHGADVHHSNHHGVSPVQLARKIANYDVAQRFADVTDG